MLIRNTKFAASILALLLISTFVAAAQVPNYTLPQNTVVGRLSNGSGPAQAIPFSTFLSTVATPCSTSARGLVPATGGGTANFLRSDCTFAAPPAPTVGNNQILANISGSSAAASGTNPSNLWDSFCSSSAGRFWVRMSSAWGCTTLGYANPVWWGADPTGASDSVSAFNSAIATGLPIKWPSGKFKINSAITVTLPNAAACFCMEGAGSNITTLYWPNASGGITVTAANLKNNFSIHDLTLTTSQVGSGSALHMIGPGCNNGCEWQSDITNVTIQGDDFSTSSSQYWTTAIWLFNWGGIYVNNVTTNGPHGAPGSAGGGTGLRFEGDGGSSSYAVILNVQASNFNFHNVGMFLGSYWQGITINQTNFNGAEGAACLQQGGAAAGTLVLLTVTNSQFNCAGHQIDLQTAVLSPTFTGNTITVYGNNNIGISAQQSGGTGLIAIGNIFNNMASFTGNYGIVWNGTTGTVVGNAFHNIANGTNLLANSTLNTVALNSYNGVTTKIINSGTNNSVGTAAAGNMTGVVP
ncbi:hypothetical protein [Bradyrhizobium sp. WSM2793]|uniref:hypothetical protein n=1 Tax=Bradyrhizobium sp. WSM2793 TaxID=1038866 RepID=UPI0012F97007|nr:hypothetical protein [Bradyrhizobium sp. WSM2793]